MREYNKNYENDIDELLNVNYDDYNILSSEPLNHAENGFNNLNDNYKEDEYKKPNRGHYESNNNQLDEGDVVYSYKTFGTENLSQNNVNRVNSQKDMIDSYDNYYYKSLDNKDGRVKNNIVDNIVYTVLALVFIFSLYMMFSQM